MGKSEFTTDLRSSLAGSATKAKAAMPTLNDGKSDFASRQDDRVKALQLN